MKSFEDLVVWQKAKDLAVTVYCLTSEGEISRDRGLRDQIRRAAVSTVGNIAEGFESSTGAEFKRYLGIAKASNGEVRCYLHLAKDIGFLNPADVGEAIEQTIEVRRLLIAMRNSVPQMRF